MENATKALLIAGGILIAMMTLALLVYVFGYMTDFAESQDRVAATQEIVEFNEGYEAYNKKKMYGTDIITVVNKAINNNKKVAQNTDDPYYVNVVVKTTKTFKTHGTKTLPNGKSADMDRSDFIKLGIERNYSELPSGLLELGEWNGDELVMKDGILKFFDKDEKNRVESKDGNTYYIYSALTDFKTSIFTCKFMEDSNKDGRIDSIWFEQI